MITASMNQCLREIARNHGLTAEAAEAHRADVWATMHGNAPARLHAVMAAWDILPGSYSYYDAAARVAAALREEAA
jgi:hypothetical protein